MPNATRIENIKRLKEQYKRTLSKMAMRQLYLEYKNGDKTMIAKIANEYMYLVIMCIEENFMNLDVPLKDLLDIGLKGIAKAIKAFEKTQFPNLFACVSGYILSTLLDYVKSEKKEFHSNGNENYYCKNTKRKLSKYELTVYLAKFILDNNYSVCDVAEKFGYLNTEVHQYLKYYLPKVNKDLSERITTVLENGNGPKRNIVTIYKFLPFVSPDDMPQVLCLLPERTREILLSCYPYISTDALSLEESAIKYELMSAGYLYTRLLRVKKALALHLEGKKVNFSELNFFINDSNDKKDEEYQSPIDCQMAKEELISEFVNSPKFMGNRYKVFLYSNSKNSPDREIIKKRLGYYDNTVFSSNQIAISFRMNESDIIKIVYSFVLEASYYLNSHEPHYPKKRISFILNNRIGEIKESI